MEKCNIRNNHIDVVAEWISFMKSVLVLVQIIITEGIIIIPSLPPSPPGSEQAAAMMWGPGPDSDPVYNVSSVRNQEKLNCER